MYIATPKGLSTLIPENGNFISGSGDFVAENGNKIACFRTRSCRFRLQCGQVRPLSSSGVSLDSGQECLRTSTIYIFKIGHTDRSINIRAVGRSASAMVGVELQAGPIADKQKEAGTAQLQQQQSRCMSSHVLH